MSGHHSAGHPRNMNEALQQQTGLNAMRCYQCGKCSAGCPMAQEMGGLPPHALIRLIQTDQQERVLKSEALWLCLTCETCSARCPNEVEPAKIIDALREWALKLNPKIAPKAIRAFHEAFLGQIRSHGRIGEFGLVLHYKLGSGDLFSDVFSAPGMLARGKLKFFPTNIEGLAELERIFAACEQEAEAPAATDHP